MTETQAIFPTRFGLKYAPIPTIALEYEVDALDAENVEGIEASDGKQDASEQQSRSLYVYRGDGVNVEEGVPSRMRKLHVMELPHLNPSSVLDVVADGLTAENEAFLNPSIINKSQVLRLLGMLQEHLQSDQQIDALMSEMEQNEGSKENEDNRGNEDEIEKADGEDTMRDERPQSADDADDLLAKVEPGEKDVEKESNRSEEEEEEIESEELEYFSEEASDDDSF